MGQRQQPRAGRHLFAGAAYSRDRRELRRIYYRNAINSGLLVIECPQIVEAVATGDEIEIDLAATQLYAGGRSYDFPQLPGQVLEIIDAGGIIPWLRANALTEKQ